MATTVINALPPQAVAQNDSWLIPRRYEKTFVASTALFSVMFLYGFMALDGRLPSQSARPAYSTTSSTSSYRSSSSTTNTRAAYGAPLIVSPVQYASAAPALGPATVLGTLDGKVIKERIYAGMGAKTYALHEGDALSIALPTVSDDHMVRFVGKNFRQMIDYATIAQLPADANGERTLNVRGAVQLSDASTALRSYTINLSFTTAGPAPVYVSPAPRVPAVPETITVPGTITIHGASSEVRTVTPRVIVEPKFSVQY